MLSLLLHLFDQLRRCRRPRVPCLAGDGFQLLCRPGFLARQQPAQGQAPLGFFRKGRSWLLQAGEIAGRLQPLLLLQQAERMKEQEGIACRFFLFKQDLSIPVSALPGQVCRQLEEWGQGTGLYRRPARAIF